MRFVRTLPCFPRHLCESSWLPASTRVSFSTRFAVVGRPCSRHSCPGARGPAVTGIPWQSASPVRSVTHRHWCRSRSAWGNCVRSAWSRRIGGGTATWVSSSGCAITKERWYRCGIYGRLWTGVEGRTIGSLPRCVLAHFMESRIGRGITSATAFRGRSAPNPTIPFGGGGERSRSHLLKMSSTYWSEWRNTDSPRRRRRRRAKSWNPMHGGPRTPFRDCSGGLRMW